MYKLTLSESEREAIDWVGYRYSHGDDLRELLESDSVLPVSIESGAGEEDITHWDRTGEVTFTIPESAAWLIRDLIYESFEETRLACFSDDLRYKLLWFADSIV